MLVNESNRNMSSGGKGYRGQDFVTLEQILEFHYETETWTEIGTMMEARWLHAVSAVTFDDYAKWCN